MRIAVVPATEPVQALAALAVHDASHPFDDDVVAMTAAARVTRAGALLVAQDRAITSLGVVEIGQVIGLVDGEVVALGESLTAVATSLLDSMLYASGELVTLVLGATARRTSPRSSPSTFVSVGPRSRSLFYSGQQARYPLLIGVE